MTVPKSNLVNSEYLLGLLMGVWSSNSEAAALIKRKNKQKIPNITITKQVNNITQQESRLRKLSVWPAGSSISESSGPNPAVVYWGGNLQESCKCCLRDWAVTVWALSVMVNLYSHLRFQGDRYPDNFRTSCCTALCWEVLDRCDYIHRNAFERLEFIVSG